jgi:hypothetical protein
MLTIDSATFEDSSLGAHASRTTDGRTFSILFDALGAHSRGAAEGACVARGEGYIQCRGRGWVALSVRGALAAGGSHAFAHLLGRVNGRRFEAGCSGAEEPFDTSIVAAVDDAGRLRVSLLLIAQGDPAQGQPAAGCRVDAIDLVVVQQRTATPRSGRTGEEHPQVAAKARRRRPGGSTGSGPLGSGSRLTQEEAP